VELPEELIPADSRVEIDAKITAGKLRVADLPQRTKIVDRLQGTLQLATE
jgi:hypothetical protein